MTNTLITRQIIKTLATIMIAIIVQTIVTTKIRRDMMARLNQIQRNN